MASRILLSGLLIIASLITQAQRKQFVFTQVAKDNTPNTLAGWNGAGVAAIIPNSTFWTTIGTSTLTGSTSIQQNGFNLAFLGTGNIGIGVAPSAFKLEVNGNIKSGGLWQAQDASHSINIGQDNIVFTTWWGHAFVRNISGGNVIMQLGTETSSSVGIGTGSPTTTSQLDVRGIAAGSIARFATNTNSPVLTISDTSSPVSWTLGAVGFQGNGGGLSFSGSSPGANTITFGAGGTFSVGSANFGLTFSGSGFSSAGGNGADILFPITASTGSFNVNQNSISSTYNTTGTYSGTVRGYYYNPTLTSTIGLTNIAFENSSGQLRFGGLTQDDTKTRVLTTDATTNQVFWRNASTLAGWSLASGGTLTGANTVTGTTTNTIKYVFNGLTGTAGLVNGAGLWLANTQNSQAAQGLLQMNSPLLTLEGQGWKTDATAESRSVKFAQYILVQEGTSNPAGVWSLSTSINNGSYVPVLGVTSSGDVNFGSIGSPVSRILEGSKWQLGLSGKFVKLHTNGFGINKETPESTLDVDGSYGDAITGVATSTTLTIAHATVKVDATTADRTITLPAASGATGRIYRVLKSDSSANTVTISTTIGGNKVISTQYAGFVVQSDGTNWYIIGAF